MTSVLLGSWFYSARRHFSRRHRETHTERTQCTDGSRDGCGAPTNQRAPKTARSHLKLGERWGIDFAFHVPTEPTLCFHSPSCVQLVATPWTAAHQASMSITISQSLSKFMLTASVMPSSHLILWHPLLLLPSIFSSITDFSNESAVHTR